MSAAFALIGAAHAAIPTVAHDKPVEHKDAVRMNETSEPSVADITARFLTFVASLEHLSDASVEGMQKKLGLAFEHEGKFSGYRSAADANGWHYYVDFFDDAPPLNRGFSFEFVNTSDNVDIAPVCFNFETVRSAMSKAGFTEQKQVGEIGQLIAFNYIKNDLKIAIFIRSATVDGNDRNCVSKVQTIQQP
jgi:hypothetical protein